MKLDLECSIVSDMISIFDIIDTAGYLELAISNNILIVLTGERLKCKIIF